MTKIVYNAQHGGFNLSKPAIDMYASLKGIVFDKSTNGSRYVNGEYWSDKEIPRSDPALVQVVEQLGDSSNGPYATLKIRELEPGTKYRIDEYDGFEAVVTIDEYDWEIA